MGRLLNMINKVKELVKRYGALPLLLAALRVLACFRRKIVISPGGTKYLTRWYLTPEGDWYRKRFPGVFLHCFHASDPDRGYHSHPWLWAVSLILKGSYTEERPVWVGGYPEGDKMFPWPKTFSAGDFNYITDDTFHRVKLLTPTVWTLFVAGPLHGDSWEFLSDEGELTPHGTGTDGD